MRAGTARAATRAAADVMRALAAAAALVCLLQLPGPALGALKRGAGTGAGTGAAGAAGAARRAQARMYAALDNMDGVGVRVRWAGEG